MVENLKNHYWKKKNSKFFSKIFLDKVLISTFISFLDRKHDAHDRFVDLNHLLNREKNSTSKTKINRVLHNYVTGSNSRLKFSDLAVLFRKLFKSCKINT